MSASKFRPASFRGVPFAVKTSELGTGRRTVTHAFPGVDDQNVEDLGRAPREFTVEAFVIGDDYKTKRNDLLNALEASGPGTLIHPTMGELTVQVGPVTVRESWDEGGMATFSIKFSQTSKTTYPQEAAESASEIATTSKRLDEKVLNAIEKVVKAANALVKNNLVQSAVAMVERIEKNLSNVLQQYNTTVENIDAFRRDVSNLLIDINELVSSPKDLAARIKQLIRDFTSLVDSFDGVYGCRKLITDLGSDFQQIKYTDSTSGRQSETNDGAFMSAVVAFSATGCADSLARTSADVDAVSLFESRQEAEQLRDQVIEWLDNIAVAFQDDPVFETATDLIGQIHDAVPPEGATLREVQSYTPGATLPALVVAHQIYGDATMADDIVARNKIVHPAAVPGGVPLEVIV